MLIDFIRHGEPQGGSRYRGHGIDDPLSEKGWAQMRAAVAGNRPWTHVISSPLMRCRVFAKALAAERGLSCSIDSAFKEIGFGEWEGKNKQELRAERAEEFANFYLDPVRNTPTGAEPVTSFLARISAGMASLQQHWPDEHLLVVAHAGVIRAAIVTAIGADAASMYRIQVRNAGITRIEYSNTQTLLVFHDAQSDHQG